MSVDIIKQQIKSGELSGLYLIYGEEAYLKSFYVTKLTEKTVKKEYESFNLQVFDNGSFSLPQIAAAVDNMPLMSDKKCVILRDIDIDGLKLNEWKELEAIISNKPQECVIIIHFNAYEPDKRGSRLKSMINSTQKNKGVAAEISHLPKRELIKWTAKRFTLNGCFISDTIADYLIDTIGSDMYNLNCEIDKLSSLARGEVTINHIDSLAIKQIEYSIYDLAKAITSGRTDVGLRIISELFYKKEEPVVILSALSSTFCDLFRAKAALISGASQSKIENDFNYKGKEFRIRNAIRDCGSLDLAYLDACLTLLMKADERLKSTRTDKKVVLEQLIIEINGLKMRNFA